MDYNIDLNQVDITLIRGVSEVFRFWGWEKVDNEGNIIPWDLIGKEIKVQFKSDLNGTADLELTVANGGLKLFSPTKLDLIFGENTLNLRKDLYYYDVLIIENGERITTVRGKLILTGVVTK